MLPIHVRRRREGMYECGCADGFYCDDGEGGSHVGGGGGGGGLSPVMLLRLHISVGGGLGCSGVRCGASLTQVLLR